MKNFSIISLIFVIPLVAYFVLTKPDPSFASKVIEGNKPQIIKFTSLMCLDCKKIDKVMKEIYPKYSKQITLIEVPVQTENDYTRKQISKYNVTLVPTLIMINSKGKQTARLEGFVDKDSLEKQMKDLTNE